MDHSTSTTGENNATSFSGRWLQFNDWLAQQRDGSSDTSEPTSDDDAPSTSGQDADYQASTPSNTTTTPSAHSHTSTTHLEPPRSPLATTSPPPLPSPPASAPRRPTSIPLILRDCRTETRLVHNYARARQEMTVMLAIPGMPLDKAPVLTARQASSLIASLSEPLAQVKVGRLTRRLEHPSKLVPTEERGTLSLWLLPDDEMSFMWHTHQSSVGAELDRNDNNNNNNNSGGNDVASSASSSAYARSDMTPLSATPTPTPTPNENLTTAPSSSTTCSSTSNQLPFTAPPLPDSVTIASSSLTMWEELAHIPAGYNFMQDGQPLVTIHMLTGDRSGRAFYIKFREDVQAVTNQKERGPGRMYFWLTEPSKSRGIQSLGALKGCWKRPTSLAKRSGVGDKQIENISNWINTHAPASNFNLGLRTPFVHRCSRRETIVEQNAPTEVRMSSSVSATANAIFKDRRYSITCPCNISIVANVTLQAGAAATAAATNPLAAQQARQAAEVAARAAVSRVGKMRVEELAAESFIRRVGKKKNSRRVGK